MADPRKQGSDQSIEGLLSEIRSVRTESSDLQHRHFGKRQSRQLTGDTYDGLTCECGSRKLPATARCPTCAFEGGYIDERTKQKLLAMLDSGAEFTNYGTRTCQCGQLKLPSASHCKACAIQMGILQATLEPGEEPCPRCGDGHKPEFTYCPGCAMAAGYLDHNRQVSAECPTDQCSCGNPKPVAFTKCRNCAKGFTGYRNQDWTNGPNPVRIFNPLPATEQAPPGPTKSNEPKATEDAPCWRCSNPTAADKRFCMDCIIAMGAPVSAFDEPFNERATHGG